MIECLSRAQARLYIVDLRDFTLPMEPKPGDQLRPNEILSRIGEGAMDTTSAGPGAGSSYYPAGALLSRWCEWDWQNGLQIERLKDLQLLKVRTRNSVYELTVVSADQSEVLVRGGRHFPELTPMRLNGSTLGGCFIRNGGIYVGFRMEFSLGGLDIFTTSPVEWIGPGEDPGEI
jgi:hypothetical protein